jgi:hypothetical protein
MGFSEAVSAGWRSLQVSMVSHFAASTLTGTRAPGIAHGISNLREELNRKTVDLIAEVLKEAVEGGNKWT